jgi:hypothetical protein
MNKVVEANFLIVSPKQKSGRSKGSQSEIVVKKYFSTNGLFWSQKRGF